MLINGTMAAGMYDLLPRLFLPLIAIARERR